MLDKELISLVAQIKNNHNKKYIATAESCTGGMIAYYITSIAGASKFFATGVVTYSNQAKIQLLNVQESTLKNYGAVSEEVALEMAQGCQKIANSDIAISVTGIAGPDGGTIEKPVGMVCFGLKTNDAIKTYTYYITGDRYQIRNQACKIGLKLIIDSLL